MKSNSAKKLRVGEWGCIIFLLMGLFPGCSIQKLFVKTTTPILQNEIYTLYEEQDLVLGEMAVASGLKLLDGFIKADPQNSKFRLFASQGYASYTLGFVEDVDKERAVVLYQRARDYGLDVLKHDRIFAGAVDGAIDVFQNAVNTFSKEDVPALFWTANSWGLLINVTRDSPAAYGDLPRVEALMQRVLALDERFYYGGAHLFFGLLNCLRPKMLGGNPEKGKEHFEKALSISDNKFLMTKVFYAQYYTVQVQNDSLFTQLLQEVLAASIDLIPEQRLVNAVAKKKARMLLARKEEFFLTGEQK